MRVAEPAVRERNGDLPITETSEEPVKNEERRCVHLYQVNCCRFCKLDCIALTYFIVVVSTWR